MLQINPHLVGYYRLLLGFSQKEFYNKGPFGRFFNLEKKGILTKAAEASIESLCTSLSRSAELLVAGVDNLSLSMIRDLQILTLGPQLRGGKNTQLGQAATREVFDLIQSVAAPYVQKQSADRLIRILNDSGRTVAIRFSGDPDVQISEELPSRTRLLVSIEIKGGSDFSNIHNRLGEAEKSHLKAKKLGCFEFWTIHRAKIALDAASRDSPTTSHFFHLDRILDRKSRDHTKFRDLLGSMMGIRTTKEADTH